MSDDALEAQHALSGHLATLVALVEPLREGTIGYRNSLMELGLDKGSADRCAADFHHWLIANIMPKGAYGAGDKK